jgi:hypothetical protein
MIESNNDVRILLFLASPPNGDAAYLTASPPSLPTNNGGFQYSANILLDDTDSHTVRTVSPDLIINKESLVCFIRVSLGSSSSGTISPFNFRIELELGAK